MVFTAYWTFPANLGAHTCVYECIIWRYSSSSSSSSRRTCGRSVCLLPSEEVCIGLSLRICSLRRPRTSTSLPPPFSLAILSSLVHFLRMSGDMLSCKDATSAHRAETFRPPRRTNLSDVHCYDERRNFPVGMDNIFRENIGNFIRERRRDKFPLFLYRGKKRISFPSTRARTDSQSLSAAQIDSLLLFSSACIRKLKLSRPIVRKNIETVMFTPRTTASLFTILFI